VIREILEISKVHKAFDQVRALQDVTLTLDEGQILCLLGPSGCGKTTLLRIVAGLETADMGYVRFAGRDLAGIAPHQRDFGLMFQEFALFPHKNVKQNVAFGLRMRQESKVKSRITELLALVGLAGFEDRDVSSLSGGERQRVALARSLAPRPRLLMLDEPLGALDRTLRERLMLEIRQILKEVGLTAIYVTHDQTEAFAVADRVVVMDRGRIEQDSTPEQLYRHPATSIVAEFLGFANLFEAIFLADNLIKTSLGTWSIDSIHCEVGQRFMALIRPEAASFRPVAGALKLEGSLESCLFRGRFYQVTCLVAGHSLTFEMFETEIPPIGSQVTLWLNPAMITCLPLRDDTRLVPISSLALVSGKSGTHPIPAVILLKIWTKDGTMSIDAKQCLKSSRVIPQTCP
jgi:ABC-type Fe3+/spermidine/putrescine transport system ATPase subunit